MGGLLCAILRRMGFFMRKWAGCGVFCLLLAGSALSQQNNPYSDTLRASEMEEIVVTATRNERKISHVAVPVTIINKQTILRAGSLRLRDILQEQTGLFLTSGFGAGVQLQGLNPDYTLILLDGEPLIGRTGGVLDLNRITVGNIRKIEIVRGPSSSLYGSEALAGVINIITDKSFDRKTIASLRYGTYQTADANLSFSGKFKKLGTSFFVNTFRTNGYSIRPFSVERSRSPIGRITPQLRLNYTLNSRTSLSIQARYNYEHILNEITVLNNGQAITSTGREINADLNIAPTLIHQFNARLKSSLRLYTTRFTGNQALNTTAGSNYDDVFRQSFYRAEQQWDYTPGNALSFVMGGGYIREEVNSSRYDNKYLKKDNSVIYGFAQGEWKPTSLVTIVGGMRYDANKRFASALSPKLAVQFAPVKQFRLQASLGRGFKAPDFRQLYLNFTNTAAGGYSVYGTLEAQRVIAFQQQAGLIQELTPYFQRLAALRPEFSTGYNIGFQWQMSTRLHWQANFFRNDISDLIESRQVAVRTDLSQIFSYINLKNAYTQGVETNFRYQSAAHFTAEAGYQFLLTADKEERALLKRNDYYFTRSAENYSVPLSLSDYAGLPNRSRHMGNLKLTYELPARHWFFTLRAIYRSRWAVFDRDGNGIYNRQDAFAKGFLLINASAGKEWETGLRIMAGIDNASDYTDVNNLPNMPGRTFYFTISHTIISNKKS